MAWILLSAPLDRNVHWRQNRSRANIALFERQHPICVAGKPMLKHFFLFAIASTGALPLAGAFAATSIPTTEAGFALASNSGGAESIAAPMPSDIGGGTANIDRAAEIALERPGGDAAVVSGNAIARDDRAGKNAPADGSAPANSTGTARKSRGNAHWQSLLPGLMK
jgi:hypothetical protein